MTDQIEVEIDGDRITVRAPTGRVLTPEDIDAIRKIRAVLRESVTTTVRNWDGDVVATSGECSHVAWEADGIHRKCADCGEALTDGCPASGGGDHHFVPVRGNGAAPTYVETCPCGATWRDGRLVPPPTPPAE